ncbi:sensor histidine kinase [Aestuariispira insulae]|uniref:histidine kinase n=1 Tax=Aestuariispira insulae TaxID=1461337 RepID=A0A3D9HXS5_9PROT|nr:HAMP domain-containing sensor histidine kinase [Aestuariispira insulae]RED54308.1 signal transduction histidine kinase [Aestuariispira insulae]
MKVRHYVKRVLPRSFYGRSLLIIVMPLVLLQLVSAWIFYDRHWDRITWRLATTIAGDLQYITEQMRDAPDKIPEIFAQAQHSMGLSLILQPGEILPNERLMDDGLIDRMLAQALEERIKRPFQIDSSSFQEEVIIDIQLADSVLTVVVPGKRLFSSTTYIFLMWMIGTSLVLFAVASIFMRNQVKPIRRLSDAVDRFGKGRDPGSDFKPEGAAEVRLAAAAFNRMMHRIRRQIRQRTDMLSGVSHDLKTPLTRIKLQLALLEQSPETEAIKGNVSEMEKMIEGYLTFARGEGGEPSVETEITALVSEIAHKWKMGGVSIDCHVEGSIMVWLKPEAFSRCIDNLISNANRYAGNIWVTTGRRGDFIEVTVDDDGPGIPEDEREKVFRPFYRLDRSRNPKTGGTGLGLAISRDVVRVHGGDLLLEDSPHGGLRARVRLPI